jgi:signal transduction histidine kinase
VGYSAFASDSAHSSGWPLSPHLYDEALDAAIGLVHADGGELAVLDESRQRLVLRARRTHPRPDASLGSFGARAPNSRPPVAPPAVRDPRGSATLDPLLSIEQQATDLLPGILLTRTYRPGERLIGFAWQRGEPVIMRGEECRALPGGTAPADTDASWHLAVPIFRPDSFAQPRANRQIVGIIAVHTRDPLWPFSPRDVELLGLHADRIAFTMEAAALAMLNEGQTALLGTLRGSASAAPELPGLFLRVSEVVRQSIDAPSFALMLFQDRDEMAFALAERDHEPLSPLPIATAALPRWWSQVRLGRTVCVAAPEDRALHPDSTVLGWGGAEPVQSLLAAPLTTGTTLLGAIVAGSQAPDAYDAEHARLFGAVARAAAIVIEHAYLADETRRSLHQTREKAEQLSVLNNAVLTLNASLDLDTTLQALVRQAKGLTSAQVCSVFLLDEGGTALVGRTSNVDSHHSPGAATTGPLALDHVRIPLAWRNIGVELVTQHYLLFDDLDTEWHPESSLGRLLAAERVKEALVLPVMAHQGMPLGALLVYTPGQHHHFPSEEIGLLQGLAGQAAIAINNARLYQQLEAAYERQKELDRYKDEFILTVSHEFRTPLTAIDGYVSLISKHVDRLSREKLEQFAGEIRQASNHLASMIGTLADASRMTSQPPMVNPVPVRVRHAAESAIRRQPPGADQRVELLTPDTLWVAADPERLEMVFSNLLSNALKYSPAPQPCQVLAREETRESLARAGHLHAAAEGAAERWVVISVVDRGEGIPTDDQAQLFQKFVRLKRSLTTSVRGTGLGLWICRQYVDAMGGDIWVESALGEGSTFRFCLPATTAPPLVP